MKLEVFIDKVDRMRKAQKEYFRTRDKRALVRATVLESLVDDMIKEYRDYQFRHPIQKDLFENND